MTDIFYGHLSDTERELAICESKFDIDLKKAELMSLYAEKMNEIKEMEAELRVLTEGGTYDDLVAYYEAEAEENNDKKESAISAFIQAISDFINGIITSIGNLFKSPEDKAKEDALKNANGDVTIVDAKKAIFAPFGNALATFKNTFSKEPTEQEAEQAGKSINDYIDKAQEALDNFLPTANLIGTAGGIMHVTAVAHSSFKYWQNEMPTIKLSISEAATNVRSAVTGGLSNMLKTVETFTGLNEPSNSKAAAVYNNAKAKIEGFIKGAKKIVEPIKGFIDALFGFAGKNKDAKKTDGNADQNANANADGTQNAGTNASGTNTSGTPNTNTNQTAGQNNGQTTATKATTNTTREVKKSDDGTTTTITTTTKGSKGGVEYYKNLKAKFERQKNAATTDEEKNKIQQKINNAQAQIAKLTPKSSTVVNNSNNTNPSQVDVEQESAEDDFFADLENYLK